MRWISIALSNLTSDSALQLSLFSDKISETKLNKIKDTIEDRYGYKALFYGKSLRKGSVRKRIKTTIGGHRV